jgi:hypothetical protein
VTESVPPVPESVPDGRLSLTTPGNPWQNGTLNRSNGNRPKSLTLRKKGTP